MNPEGLAELEVAARGAPGTLHTRQIDVSDERQIGELVDWAFDRMGGLNALTLAALDELCANHA